MAVKYVRNNTRENLVIRSIINDKAFVLRFPKFAVTEIDETLDASLIAESGAYNDLFDDGVFEYVARPTEVADTSACKRYFLGAFYDATKSKFTFKFSQELLGENVGIKIAPDGDMSNVMDLTSSLADETSVDITVNATDFIEFRVMNNVNIDFPIFYSDLTRVYK